MDHARTHRSSRQSSAARATRARLARLTAVAPVIALLGCMGTMEDIREPGPNDARLRVVHLSPDAPPVDVLLDGDPTPAFTELAFGSSTDYALLDAGSHRVDIAASGTTDAVLTADVALEGTRSYTAVAFDRVAGIRGLVIHDETRNTPRDRVRVRFVHAAAGVGEVDVWNLPRDGAPAPLFTDVGFGDAGAPSDVPSGTHVLGLDVDDDATADLVFELPDLSPGIYVNLFAATDDGGRAFLLAQLPGGITARIDARESGPRDGNAHVRVLHASPDAPAVDVFVGDSPEPAVSNVPFTRGSGYAELPAGAYRFRVSATGTGAEAAVLDASGVALAEGASYTVVAYDRLASIRALVLEDDYEGLSAASIRLRPVHAAVGVGAVDVFVIDALGGVRRIADDLAFGSAGAAIDVPVGEYQIALDANDDGLGDLFFHVPALAGGTVANVLALTGTDGAPFLLGQLRDGNTLPFAASTDERPQGRVRVLHLSPDAPAVDVFANGAGSPVVSGLAFGEGTASLALPAGSYDLAVSASGSTAADAVLSVDGFSIEAGTDTTVVAYDRLSSIAALAIADDLSPTRAGQIRVRVVHTASGVGEVDVLNMPEHGIPSVLVDDLPFGRAADALDLPAGQYRIGLDLNDDRVPEATFALPRLTGGTIANVFAVAEPSAVYLVAQLADGATLRIDASH